MQFGFGLVQVWPFILRHFCTVFERVNEFCHGLLEGSSFRNRSMLLPQGMKNAFLCFMLLLQEDTVKCFYFFPLQLFSILASRKKKKKAKLTL